MNSPFFVIITSDYNLNEIKNDSKNGSIFLILSILLIGSASLNIIPIKKAFYRLIFLLCFSYTMTQSLLSIAYPLNASNDTSEHEWFSYPFIHTLVLVILTTSSGLHSTLPKESSIGESIFLIVMIWIIVGIIFCTIYDLPEQLDGTLWATIFTSTTIAIITRINEFIRHFTDPKITKSTSTATTICGLASVLTILSAIGLSLLGHNHLASDFLVPISSLILFTTKKNLFIPNSWPGELSVITSIVWWILRSIYEIFINGYSIRSEIPNGFIENFGIFQNANVSIWTSTLPGWLIAVNILLMLLPLPAAIISFMNRKNESEEIIFVLAIMSMISLIGSQTNCIRFIGGITAIYASWRCYDISIKNSVSSRIQ